MKIKPHVKQGMFRLIRARNCIWQVFFPPLCVMYLLTYMYTQVTNGKNTSYETTCKYILEDLFQILSTSDIRPKVYEAWSLRNIEKAWKLYLDILQQISRLWFATDIHIMRYTCTSISELTIFSRLAKAKMFQGWHEGN